MRKFLLFFSILFIALTGRAQVVRLPINVGFDEDPTSFVNMGGLTYFIAYSNNTGYELYKSDGTPGGTVLAVDIYAGGGSSLFGSKLHVYNNTLYFFATDSAHGFELWKSDGTTAGTTCVKYVYNTNNNLAVDSNTVYFDATFSVGVGIEPAISDGTTGGTGILKDIYPGTTTSSPNGFTVLAHNKVLFMATGLNGKELYVTDGTDAGTTLLKDINIYSTNNSAPCGFTKYGNSMLFYANDSIHGTEPWITDGTAGGTQLLLDITPGTGNSTNMNITSAPQFTVYNGLAYFSPSTNMHLFVTDGTTGGTHQFMNAYTTSSASFNPYGGRLYFAAKTNGYYDIWSIGTAADTVRHTFYGNLNTFPVIFGGTSAFYFVLKNIFDDRNLYTLDVTTCATPAAITGNVPLTCDNHGITLSAGSYSTYTWSTGGTGSQLNVSAAGTYTVTVQDAGVGCTSSATVNVTQLTSIAAPAICGVTVDSITGKNQIIWNKHNAAFSKTLFRLERETGINQFILVADIPYDSLSMYIDTVANPMVNSSRYRLTLLDSCGNISAASTVHETVHLSQNVGINGEVNLIWNAYSGNSYTQVIVQRSVNGGAWADLSTLSGNVVSYSDLTPPSGTLNYQIAVLLDSTCTPTRSVFSLYSNRVSLVATGIRPITGTGQLLIMPNPVSSVLQIQLPEIMHTGNIIITDLTGRTIRTLPVTSLQLTEDVSALASGVYMVHHSSGQIKAQYFLKQ